jgi:hypothetical protein
MTRPHPALIALGVIGVAATIGLWWLAAVVLQAQRELQWSGDVPTPEVIRAWAFFNFANMIAIPALATAAAASALGIVLVWCLSPGRQRATRTMSEAGSTRNRAETTVPNSSPSISSSSGAASISMSTTRPRE